MRLALIIYYWKYIVLHTIKLLERGDFTILCSSYSDSEWPSMALMVLLYWTSTSIIHKHHAIIFLLKSLCCFLQHSTILNVSRGGDDESMWEIHSRYGNKNTYVTHAYTLPSVCSVVLPFLVIHLFLAIDYGSVCIYAME